MHGCVETTALAGSFIFSATCLFFTYYGRKTSIYLQHGGDVPSSGMCCAPNPANVNAEGPVGAAFIYLK
jgi:hypothetical protein